MFQDIKRTKEWQKKWQIFQVWKSSMTQTDSEKKLNTLEVTNKFTEI